MKKILHNFFAQVSERVARLAKRFGKQILFSIGFLVSLALSFEGGFLYGRDRTVDPVVVTLPMETASREMNTASSNPLSNLPASGNEASSLARKGAGAASAATLVSEIVPQKTGATEESSQKIEASSSPEKGASSCVFVGSKNSDKYHLPTCSWARRIKPANRVCFSSEEDARSKGYTPGCLK